MTNFPNLHRLIRLPLALSALTGASLSVLALNLLPPATHTQLLSGASLLSVGGSAQAFNAPGLDASELAVIVNTRDPLSDQIANYYMQQRHIPEENVAYVSFNPERQSLDPAEFEQLKHQIDAQIPTRIQAYAVTWVEPFRVGCMSLTSALAFGFDPAFCSSGCEATQASPYFNSESNTPHDDYRIRPAMAIAATDFQQAKALIDRGVAADHSWPLGKAYLLSTSDPHRNIRSSLYPATLQNLGSEFTIEILEADTLKDQTDVMFYFTGLTQVSELQSNQFLAGAMADHLTSFGGILTGPNEQMNSLAWLEAGATGSYGTVVEPCNFPQKFPHPTVAMSHYLQGDTLLEAYWKSVAWPGQGLFVGEPLARPFGNLNPLGSNLDG
ncbi:MAG: TIGR03790 family protein [Cyanobacteria bacterium P01_H01_bin.121]